MVKDRASGLIPRFRLRMNLSVTQWAILLMLILGIAAVGLIAAGSSAAEGKRPGLSLLVFGVGLLLAGASFSLAAMIGFLFGVPRTMADAEPEERGRGGSIEVVADWLTKMLIGAVLVSIPRLPDLWRQVIARSDLDPFGPPGPADELGGLIIAYFALIGFVAGYIGTRLRFAPLRFRPAALEEGIRLALSIPLTPERAPAARLSLEDLRAIEQLGASSPHALRSDSERRAWAKAQAIGGHGDLEGAIEIYDGLVRASSEPQLLLEYADILDRAGRRDRAQEYREKAIMLQQQPGEASPEATIDRIFRALYEREGFREAIRLGEPLAERIQNDRLSAYLACAYGQLHRHLVNTQAPKAMIDSARGRALYCVKQAVELDAVWRPILRALWDPNAIAPGGDNDLASLYDDLEFRAVLDPDSLPASQSAVLAHDIRTGIESVLKPAPLVRYSGHVEFLVTTKEGVALERSEDREAWWATPGLACRLVVRLLPGPAPAEAAGSLVPLVIDGEDRPEADFELRMDSGEVRFSPDRMTEHVKVDRPTSELDFGFDAPAMPGSYELWLEISQARRTVQNILVDLEVGGSSPASAPGVETAGESGD